MTAMEMDDSDLIAAMQNGDAVAFETLLTRHYDLIFRLAFRTLGSSAAAEDLTQEICVTLPERLRGFKREAKFTTWLYRVVSNAAIDQLRRAKSFQKAATGWGDVERDRQAQIADAQDDRAWLASAMRQLNEDLQQTVALVLGEGLNHAEAAEVLNVSEGTISWRIAEVKKTLKKLHATEASLT